MKKILGLLGKAGKGLGTVAGIATTALGVSLGGGDKLAECASELAKSPDSALAGIGAALTLFGIARKAGWIGAQSASKGK